MSDVTATGNYSYLSQRNHGRNYVMIGDAYAFIDPVFSSGVWLAMKGGVFAADAIATLLCQPEQRQAALQRFDERMRHGPREFSWFIYRISNPTMRAMFMSPSNKYRMKEALLSMLAGDIYDDTPIWPGVRKLKGAFYLLSFLNPRRTWQAWKNASKTSPPSKVCCPSQQSIERSQAWFCCSDPAIVVADREVPWFAARRSKAQSCMWWGVAGPSGPAGGLLLSVKLKSFFHRHSSKGSKATYAWLMAHPFPVSIFACHDSFFCRIHSANDPAIPH